MDYGTNGLNGLWTHHSSRITHHHEVYRNKKYYGFTRQWDTDKWDKWDTNASRITTKSMEVRKSMDLLDNGIGGILTRGDKIKRTKNE